MYLPLPFPSLDSTVPDRYRDRARVYILKYRSKAIGPQQDTDTQSGKACFVLFGLCYGE